MKALTFYLIRHTLQCLKRAGFDWRPKREMIKRSITKDLGKINDILADGLDVGTLIQHTIPVKLVHHPEHGWCFDGGKSYGLYRVLSNL